MNDLIKEFSELEEEFDKTSNSIVGVAKGTVTVRDENGNKKRLIKE